MTPIESLTEAQTAELANYREKWLRIGLATGKPNRKRAEQAARAAYEVAGLPAPTHYLWAKSPLAGARMAAAAQKFSRVPGKVDLRKVTKEEAVAQLSSASFGQHDANWLSSYDYCDTVLGIKEAARLRPLMDLAEQVGWCWFFDDLAILTHRPVSLFRDPENRLHCETGPAVLYGDGFAVYAVHGVRLPRDVIEDPKSLTVARIDGETNAEVKRVMLDRYGISAYLVESGTQASQTDRFGTLYRRPIEGDEELVVVRVKNSTPEPDGTFKDYFLRVPPAVTTAMEAVAWTFNVDPSEYQPEQET